MVLRIFHFWKFHYIFGLKKCSIFSKIFKILSLQPFYCLILPKFCLQVCSLCWKFGTVLNCFENFDFNLILELIKNSKIVSVHSKVVMFTKAIARFVFNFVYWFVNPIGTWCHWGNTGSGESSSPRATGAETPPKTNISASVFHP